ncbi:uncharacterized protein LOC106465726 [Limulus polyphemus]|uniref:Uncharacterized protein LOC106465726 n=1 Tax=Limulus polyphemus TaxID=6850 RepID=A0ABM1BGA6_LIMPO|nr:uncharacterized protein LOC106465726 [Limulus polyphemus]
MLFRADRPSVRQITTSQVLSLNITNLIIIFLIKLFLLGIGVIGFGGLGTGLAAGVGGAGLSQFGFGGGLGARKLDELGLNLTKLPSSTEDLEWMTTYLKSVNTDQYSCLNRLACDHPSTARAYIAGGKMAMKFLRNIKWLFSVESAKYEKLLHSLQEAMAVGETSKDTCFIKYACKRSGNKRRK